MTRDNVCSRLQFCNAHVTVDSSYYIVNTRNKKLLLLKSIIFFFILLICDIQFLKKTLTLLEIVLDFLFITLSINGISTEMKLTQTNRINRC